MVGPSSARDVFLSGMGAIYLMAFVSYYMQYEGEFTTCHLVFPLAHIGFSHEILPQDYIQPMA